jgi:hypothetical protein
LNRQLRRAFSRFDRLEPPSRVAAVLRLAARARSSSELLMKLVSIRRPNESINGPDFIGEPFG